MYILERETEHSFHSTFVALRELGGYIRWVAMYSSAYARIRQNTSEYVSIRYIRCIAKPLKRRSSALSYSLPHITSSSPSSLSLSVSSLAVSLPVSLSLTLVLSLSLSLAS